MNTRWGQKPAFRIAFVVALLAGGILLMRLIYKVRIEELGQNFEAAADKTMALRSLGLIARYQLIQNRMKHGETIALLRKETTTSFAGADSLSNEKHGKYPIAYHLGLAIVNFVNRIAGARLVSSPQRSRAEHLMDEAYLLELQRNFADAVPVYDQLIAETQDRDQNLASFARLHRAYCLSFTEQKLRAADDYRLVIRANVSGEYRVTAEVLLAYLEEFSLRTELIARMPQSVEKGNAYFNAGAYTSAIATLEALPTTQRTLQSSYLLGRSYEELGKAEQALEKYRSLITRRPDSKIAKLANRRIYAMGSIYASGAGLLTESTKNAKDTLADEELVAEQKRMQPLNVAIAEKREELQSRIAIRRVTEPGANRRPVPVSLSPEPASGGITPDKAQPQQVALSPNTKKSHYQAAPAPEAMLSRGERKAIIEREARIDELQLSDGNRLWGIILGESKEHLHVLTVMGKLQISKDSVLVREEIDSANAFKKR